MNVQLNGVASLRIAQRFKDICRNPAYKIHIGFGNTACHQGFGHPPFPLKKFRKELRNLGFWVWNIEARVTLPSSLSDLRVCTFSFFSGIPDDKAVLFL